MLVMSILRMVGAARLRISLGMGVSVILWYCCWLRSLAGMGKTPFGANCHSGMEKPPLQCQRAAEIGPIPSIARKRKIVEGENHSGLEWWVRENFEEKRAESSLLGCQNSQKMDTFC